MIKYDFFLYLKSGFKCSVMNYPKRKTFKICFSIACSIVVLFMVGYWLYKYEIEDRDIGVVDYVSLDDADDTEFPFASLCFMNPFVIRKLKSINYNITWQMYLQYLNGELSDRIYESQKIE